jgi:hypothetical protein
MEKEVPGKMTVQEAGHLGGEIGGQRIRELIQEGKEMEREEGKGSETGRKGRKYR